MNTKQWQVLLTAIALFTMSELFPPRSYECQPGLYSAGHHFFTKQPEPGWMCPSSGGPLKPPIIVKDSARLNLQRITLTLLMVGFLLVIDHRRTTLKVLIGYIALCIGVAGFLLYLLMVSFDLHT
jgi:hypothetical protein